MKLSRRNIFTDTRRKQTKRNLAIAFLALTACILLVVAGVFPDDEGSPTDGATTDISAAIESGSAGEAVSAVPEVPAPVKDVAEGTIRSGQTASALLNDWLSALDIHNLSLACKDVYSLTRLRAGRPYAVTTLDGAFASFVYEIDNEKKLVVSREGEKFTATLEAIPYESRTVVLGGEIESSLYAAVDKVGEHPALAVRLADIFAWDVDFIRDIRSGDSFRAVVEKRYRKGEFSGYGRITAAEFVNQGESFRGFLFPEADGQECYFDEKGKSLRKTFLKAPLAFKRISSGYSNSRLHPILKIRRPHHGIDYAAPTGTPIKAIGDGVISRVAWGKGAGRYIKIRHNSVYESTYMHMSRYARGMKKGRRVHQGEVIGFVGATGYATGPHLDFRMKKNGSYINPRRIKSPSAAPVPKDRMQEFRETIAPLVAQLEGMEPMQAAASPKAATIIN